jgi:hypothetical protein
VFQSLSTLPFSIYLRLKILVTIKSHQAPSGETPHIIPHLAIRCKGKIEESRGAGAESDGKSDMCNGKSAPIQRMFGTYPTEEEKSLTRLGTKGYVTLQPKVG